MENKTTLYIATHNTTGKKYFGKTKKYFTVEDLQKHYHGSGVYWKKHLDKHGDDVSIEIYMICSSNPDDDNYVKPIALKFSEENDIVESNDWANFKPENGLDGGTEWRKGKTLIDLYGEEKAEEIKKKKSIPQSEETKLKISKTLKENPVNFWLGKERSEETKIKIGNIHRGKEVSQETRQKISESTKGISQPKVECPHCGKTGGNSSMKRWHFDNCKVKSDGFIK